jgi:hypothetical protein
MWPNFLGHSLVRTKGRHEVAARKRSRDPALRYPGGPGMNFQVSTPEARNAIRGEALSSRFDLEEVYYG